MAERCVALVAASVLRRRGHVHLADLLDRQKRGDLSREEVELELNRLDARDLLRKPPAPYPFKALAARAYVDAVLGRTAGDRNLSEVRSARAEYRRWYELVREQLLELLRLTAYFARREPETADRLADRLRSIVDLYDANHVPWWPSEAADQPEFSLLARIRCELERMGFEA